MISVEFNYKEYTFSNVIEEDLHELVNWIKDNNSEDKSCLSLDEQLFYRRYLEYYFSNEECFVKVKDKDNKLISVFKGRIEDTAKAELFIWFFVISKEVRNEGIGTRIVDAIIEFFENNYGIKNFETGVVETNIEGISFWNSLGFGIKRISTNFFEGDISKSKNLVVMKK